ncbi:nucleoside/nucleotide kinase family protein [Glycomyces niveus]|uniref:nucleoside/nucleotide kinase family protein n=1 Tax=Glycomyces niveus TaxID=2820287 RepID=UPI0027DCE22F|nr:nucleoside/nucleotide kinase family protein [Glycomyces sp. NEAU-S30]
MDIADDPRLLLDRVRALRAGGGRVLIGVAGCPGAGKSTVAAWLARALDPAGERAVQVPMDGFHLANAELVRLGRRQRKGAIDTFDGHGYLALLERIAARTDSTVYAPEFDRRIGEPVAGAIAVPPSAEVVVTEGNYLLDETGPWPEVRKALTEVWYCETPEPLRLARLVARHERFGKSPEHARSWVAEVDERNAERIRAARPRADLVIDFERLRIGRPEA